MKGILNIIKTINFFGVPVITYMDTINSNIYIAHI